jgi:hypothetical protein
VALSHDDGRGNRRRGRVTQPKEGVVPLLFSYGTLQREQVQLSIFERRLAGEADALVGYEQAMLAIDDPDVVKTSGLSHHPIVRYTGDAQALVSGTVFDITDAELAQADGYEVADYVRVLAPLRSGRSAWVYVDRRHAPQP